MYCPSLSLHKKSATNCFEIGKLTLLHSFLFVDLNMVMAQTFIDKILINTAHPALKVLLFLEASLSWL